MIGTTSYYSNHRRRNSAVWQSSLEIPGTGHRERIVFNAKTGDLRRESMLNELKPRIREPQLPVGIKNQ